MNLLHHTTIGTVQSVDFVRNDCKIIHFFTKHSQDQTVPLILLCFLETFKYSSLWMCSTRIAFVRSNLANLSEIFFKRELILVQNV